MRNSAEQPSQFIGVGVGPGDPGLITLKAADYIRNADIVSYIEGTEGQSQARLIANEVLQTSRSDQREIAVLMPMSENRELANQAYDQAAADIQQALDQGLQVVFLCEGDPLFFGSFTYLLSRLDHNRCEVVPGISSIHAAASALQQPLTLLKESFAVVSGRHSREHLVAALQHHDSVVIMKAGRSRVRILEALEATGRVDDAAYCEYIGRDNEWIEQDVRKLSVESGPYFSLFVVTRTSRAIS
ncbi:MAG: precorrin-2 C(20)-methyltransferase [Pseudomonadota bacterium]